MELRVGLLVCDHVSPEFRDIAGDYPDMFRRLFASYPGIDMVDYDLPGGDFPSSPSECDAWMTTGSRHSVYEQIDWIEHLAGFVRDIAGSERPYVGVCFGHQMIAHALGGRVEKAPTGWGVGVKRVEVTDPPPWLPLESFRILNSHADQVTRLPPGAVGRGGNSHCPVSLMTLGDRMAGIQGHPEFTPEYAEGLLVARRGKVIPPEVADAALASLAEETDAGLVADGIVDFITSGRSAN